MEGGEKAFLTMDDSARFETMDEEALLIIHVETKGRRVLEKKRIGLLLTSARDWYRFLFILDQYLPQL